MLKNLKIFAFALVATGMTLFARGGDDLVLYWMVDDPTVNCLSDGSKKLSGMTLDGKSIDSARVVAFLTSEKGAYEDRTISASDLIYLDLYYEDENGNPVVDPTLVPRADTAEVKNGMVKPWQAASIMTQLSGKDLSMYSFAIELGVWSGDGTSVDDEWMLAAISSSATYAELKDFITEELAVPDDGPWQPGGYVAAPEPSSGLLVLIGGSLLALRRRRRKDVAA